MDKHVKKALVDVFKEKDTKKVGIEMDWSVYEDMQAYKTKHRIPTMKELIQKAVKEYIQK